MQLYAFDLQHHPVSSRQANKQTDYYCPECKGLVRLRGGPQRQNHFYHIEASRSCRQNGKSEEHLQIQLFFFRSLPKGECFLEKHFSSIHRIADVVWETKKIIFEIQCSPIKAKEICDRNRDYEREGYQVVWILHDSRFNQPRPSSAEIFLRHSSHYYTNIGADGKGFFLRPVFSSARRP